MSAPAFVVHALDHALAAVAACAERGLPVTLVSAPGAAAYLGAQVFREMVAEAGWTHPEVKVTAVLDCGEDVGLALQALRHGLKVIRLTAAHETRAKVADIAAQTGARLADEHDKAALDLLGAADPLAACRDWLAHHIK
jgi:fructose/tagatose bisphosphate aldolase